MSDLQKNLMKSKLPPMPPMSRQKSVPGRQKDYSPSEWKQFFHDFVDVAVDEKNTFRCYRSEPAETGDAPVLVLLHGGGNNALTWACFNVSLRLQKSFCFFNCDVDFRKKLLMLFTASAWPSTFEDMVTRSQMTTMICLLKPWQLILEMS